MRFRRKTQSFERLSGRSRPFGGGGLTLNERLIVSADSFSILELGLAATRAWRQELNAEVLERWSGPPLRQGRFSEVEHVQFDFPDDCRRAGGAGDVGGRRSSGDARFGRLQVWRLGRRLAPGAGSGIRAIGAAATGTTAGGARRSPPACSPARPSRPILLGATDTVEAAAGDPFSAEQISRAACARSLAP